MIKNNKTALSIQWQKSPIIAGDYIALWGIPVILDKVCKIKYIASKQDHVHVLLSQKNMQHA